MGTGRTAKGWLVVRGEVDSQNAEPMMFLSVDRISDAGWQVPAQIEDRTVDVWGFLLEGTASTVAMCRQWLSAEERARAGRFVRPEDGSRYILARGCLRAVLARYTGRNPSVLLFQLGATGKPALAAASDSEDRIYFNLSHSHGRMLIAVAKDREVGVDLEQIRDSVDVAKLAQRFYAPAECESMIGLPGTAQAPQFFRYWAAKEAFLKCKGVGLQFPLNRCEVTLLPNGKTAPVSWKTTSGSVEQGLVRFLFLEDGWVGAVSTEGDEWRTDVRQWS